MKKKLLFTVTLAMLLLASLVPASMALAENVDVIVGVYDSTLNLENKDSSWAIVSGDSIGGTLGYNPSGSTFDFGLYATGLSDGDYALIYYADTEDRFNDWGGDNPGAVIATGTSSGGELSMTGSVELNMDLPCPPDANAYFYDYTEAPDNYVHGTGAKIWVVPTSVLTDGTSLPVCAWPQTSDWLFETDLVTYDDTDIVSDIVAISVSPATVNFGILTPGTTGNGGDITVTNTGTVPCNVSAIAPSIGVLQYILLDDAPVSSYSVTSLSVSASDVAAATLPVPSDYEPSGIESGTLTFTATSAIP